MKKVLYRIYVIVILIVILINVFSIFHLSFLGFRIYRIGSGSMQPYLNVNDYILIKKQDKYLVNDVVTYQVKNDEYVTHRIIDIKEDTVITKGDANNTEDDAISINDIMGKVILKSGVISFILYLFSKPLSWILLLIFGFLITILIPNKNNE